MRIVFMGSPAFAVPTLDALVDAGHDVVAAYSQPARPAGRGKALQPTAVERRARERGIEVRTPRSLRGEEEQAAFAALDADVAVVAAYGLILPQPILDSPRHGCLNVHGSLLPRWRGAAPVQRAIMAGDDITGITIMEMEKGLDTGPMLLSREVSIGNKNAGELTEELAALGATLMIEALDGIDAIERRPQPDEGVTYASKITKEEARIDWSRPSHEIRRKVQGLAPFPGAWCEVAGERVKILAADEAGEEGIPGTVMDKDGTLLIATGQGSIRPTLLQRAGRGVMTVDEFVRGFPLAPGTQLS